MTQCDRQRLQRLLDESLPETTECEVAEHLAECPDCQNELETLAATKGWWLEASQRLSKTVERRSASFVDDAERRPTMASMSGGAGPYGDELSEERSNHGSSGYGSSHDDDANHFATDFAVDFLDPSTDPAMLGRLGEYEIVQVIGRGGMGIVLKGYQKELHRFVAVKVLAPHLATSGAARRRFAREAQATAAIVHPHVMAIHSVHANVKLPYLVMPFVACESLQERLDRQGPLDVKDVLRIGMQAALGLAAAHAQGLVHRDVKPANILLETNVDRVMLTDFGLARAVDDATLTRTGVIAGTPQYMSPEQANGDAVDHRSDLFSLGGVLYAMCTGRPPFRAETTFGVLRRIREASPRPIREINADIPVWLEQIVMRLLSKDAGSRIDSAELVASLLERCLAHVQQPTTTALPGEIEEWRPRPIPSNEHRSRSALKTVQFRIVLAVLILIPIVLVVIWPRAKLIPTEEKLVASSGTSGDPGSSDSDLQWNATRTELQATAEALEPLEATMQRDLEFLAADGKESETGTNASTGGQPDQRRFAAFMGTRDVAMKVAFVIDKSGSMSSHDAMRVAKQELITSVQALEETQQFAIIFYDGTVHRLKLHDETNLALTVASEENKGLAIKRISEIEPGSGTDHVPPLMMALGMKPDVIFFLTDALDPPIWPKELQKIKTLNSGNVRIHCIEFGQGPELQPANAPANFLQKLATQNGGTYRYCDVTRFTAPKEETPDSNRQDKP